MKVLLTGANGYVGSHLLPVLIAIGHHVVCLVRDPNRFKPSLKCAKNLSVISGDLENPESLKKIPTDIDEAFFLVHSMSYSADDFYNREALMAQNFTDALRQTTVKKIIYLSGIANDPNPSTHMRSRHNVEIILQNSGIPTTTLRAAIIIGSGSASFEIMRDLVEKLPVMVAPKWLNVKCQPIAISNVIECLEKVMGENCYINQAIDIGGPDILSYKEMLLKLAKVRGLKRFIFTVPVLTPRLSSYWLYFVTSTSYTLARSLVDSMTNEFVARDQGVMQKLGVKGIGFEEAVRQAFSKIKGDSVISSWHDAWVSGRLAGLKSDQIDMPTQGCFIEEREIAITSEPEIILDRVFSIGGDRGWYYMNWLWQLRGFIDKVFGGVGLRRGRKNPHSLNPGDALDFWRVLVADRAIKRLLLYAEMKLPGEGWLEFKMVSNSKQSDWLLSQKVVFRPKGVFGRVLWYMLWPFHVMIFRGLLKAIVKK